MGKGKTKTINVGYLARVEGEGSLYVKYTDNKVEEVQLKIFEPPRFFEAFLQGRGYAEAPDITARICGICPVAYQMSSVHAMENAFGIKVDGPLRDLRRLLYCGEWIESHALHIYMLHAPDFLGYESAIHMAGDHADLVQQGLQLKKAGNTIVNLVGGREIHPINVRVGGFYKVPTKKELLSIKEELQKALDISVQTLAFVGKLDFPELEQDYEFVALRHESEYPFNEGRLVSNRGLDIDISEYETHFREVHMEHSNALHSEHINHGAYLVGPMARYNLNFDRLSPSVQQLAKEANLPEMVINPFQSIVVRAVEMLYAVEEAIRIIDNYTMPDAPFVEVSPVKSEGAGCTEAPRGILYHRYKVGDDGLIKEAKIVPPTSQNQKRIEEDLRSFVEKHHQLSDEELTWQCEQAIRNYDPCISCATHFLKLKIDRS